MVEGMRREPDHRDWWGKAQPEGAASPAFHLKDFDPPGASAVVRALVRSRQSGAGRARRWRCGPGDGASAMRGRIGVAEVIALIPMPLRPSRRRMRDRSCGPSSRVQCPANALRPIVRGRGGASVLSLSDRGCTVESMGRRAPATSDGRVIGKGSREDLAVIRAWASYTATLCDRLGHGCSSAIRR